MVFSDRLLCPGGSRLEDALYISQGYLFFIEAKHQSLEKSYIPKAVSQAIALLRSTRCVNTACFTPCLSIFFSLPEVRFCLSDGQTWIFFIVKLANDTPTYYESATYHLSRDNMKNSDLPLRVIVQLVREWVGFSIGTHICFSWTICFS